MPGCSTYGYVYYSILCQRVLGTLVYRRDLETLAISNFATKE